MFAFIKRHWLCYLIGLAIAVALGLGGAFLVGVKGSTHRDGRQTVDQLDGGSSGLSGVAGSGADAAAS
ncbi:hypothetical protein Corgl_1790 [Coriobacterium glomerans PW2]|uniref:Uncharacterized protein n=1 Tax=Coriobacterium glomerans (strain ATCC 49209 / DSM 20642 / JCM 10262 / PW2) TaxID=700015 RepID=F2N9D7_CORGP|nr:hypothetical protein [Coriobacterium glomerans]AEB07885.1 hypothetical protein Corgl_1790 [Coriobacterium glomerans PW2]